MLLQTSKLILTTLQMVVMSLLESTAFLMPGPQEVLSKLSDIPLWVGVMGESDGNRDGKE